MAEFLSAIDICNRGLQYLGSKRIDPVLGFTEVSSQASECSFVYGKLRRAELRRNIWRFAVRRTILRPLNTLAIQGGPFVTNPTVSGSPVSPSMLLAPPLYSSSTTYPSAALVTDVQGSIWQSLAPANANFPPGAAASWELYTGPLTVDAWVSTTTYYAGDLAYVAPGDGTYTVYQSLLQGNTAVPGTATAYSATEVYAKDETALYNSVLYQSLVELNYGNTPASSPTQWTTTITSGTSATGWRVVPAELRPIVTPYPLSSGPSTQLATRNAFRLPSAWLREAPQDPKAGGNSILGSPSGLPYNDWTYDGDYIVSRVATAIPYRFVADITNVLKFDDMFCEAIAARVAYSVCETLTQSNAKLQTCAQAYQKWVSEARTVNGIEQGSTEPAIDDFIAVRA